MDGLVDSALHRFKSFPVLFAEEPAGNGRCGLAGVVSERDGPQVEKFECAMGVQRDASSAWWKMSASSPMRVSACCAGVTVFVRFASNSEGESAGRMTQQAIRIVPQTPATTVPAAPQLLPATPATPEPLPETGNDDHLVMWSMLLIAFGTLITLASRQRQAPS